MGFFRNVSLKKRLIISFLMVLMIPSILLTQISYLNTKNKVREEQIISSKEALNLLNNNISAIIEPKIHQVNFFTNAIDRQILEQSPTSIESLLTDYLAMNSGISSAVLATENRSIIKTADQAISNGNLFSSQWAELAMEKEGELIITDPHVSSITNESVITIAQSLKDRSGVFAVEIPMKEFEELASTVTIGEAGFVTLVDSANNYIFHPTEQSESQFANTSLQTLTTANSYKELEDYTVVFSPNEQTGWKIYSNIVNEEAEMASKISINLTIFVIIICIIVFGIFVYFLIQSITKPINILLSGSNTISKGDLSKPILVTSNDEIGELSKAFEEMRKSLLLLISEVRTSVTNVNASSSILYNNASETVAATSLGATSVEQIAKNLDAQMISNEQNVETILAMEKQIENIVLSSKDIANLSKDALSSASSGNTIVQKTVNQMQSISHSVTYADENVQKLSNRMNDIYSIVDTIAAIANQTNLLSLNAAIEAAHAGIHGAGFSVVAKEVGVLAENSKQSTEQITQLINQVQLEAAESVQYMQSVTQSVAQGIELTHQTKQQFSHISNTIERMEYMIKQIFSNTQQLLVEVKTATESANLLSSQSQENVAAIEEIAAITEQINLSMQRIDLSTKSVEQLSAHLDAEISKFTI